MRRFLLIAAGVGAAACGTAAERYDAIYSVEDVPTDSCELDAWGWNKIHVWAEGDGSDVVTIRFDSGPEVDCVVEEDGWFECEENDYGYVVDGVFFGEGDERGMGVALRDDDCWTDVTASVEGAHLGDVEGGALLVVALLIAIVEG